MTNKDIYRSICRENKLPVPIFMQDWWLDEVCLAGEWDVIFAEDNNEIVAALPLYIKKKAGFKILTMPPLTPFMGPVVTCRENQSYNKRLSFEKKIFDDLIDALMSYAHSHSISYFLQSFDRKVTNFLPFFWRGFRQRSRYTYQIKKLDSHEEVRKEYKYLIRRRINKAANKFKLKIVASDDFALFLSLNEKTFNRQGLSLPYSRILVENLDKACSRQNCRKIFLAIDPEGQCHAALYLIYDYQNSVAYYLMSGTDPDLRKSDALSLLMDYGIQQSLKEVATFDFEGSMIEPIEQFFRAFGAKQVPYFVLEKPLTYTSAFLWHAREILEDIKGLRKSKASRGTAE